MKIKQNVTLTNPERFLRGDYSTGFLLTTHNYSDDGEWIHCGEIEIDIDVDSGKLIKAVSARLDKEIGKHTAALHVLETRKAELLSLTHEGAK
ncbi:MAG: hypothetical protein KOO63_08325 [Bacteroidales bacterium]|nr:hypothetical protein [Candidatus Latescibacterota bacterium]